MKTNNVSAHIFYEIHYYDNENDSYKIIEAQNAKIWSVVQLNDSFGS